MTTDSLVLDLFIQDFITTNKILNQHMNWEQLVNRRFAESVGLKVFEFTSGGDKMIAKGQLMQLPAADYFRIELTTRIPEEAEHRFPCLQMTQTRTHSGVSSERMDAGLIVRMETRHRGLINVVFVIRNPDLLGATSPFTV
jgi:hypothetical protein